MTLPFALPSSSRKQLALDLTRHVHHLLLLEWQLRQAHWNTRGPWFFARHELFEKVGDVCRSQLDILAERVGALGHAVEMRPDVVTRSAPPVMPDGLCRGETYIEYLTHAVVRIVHELRSSVDVARALSDSVTEDILTETIRTFEKQTWLLRRHLRPDDSTQPSASTMRAPSPRPTKTDGEAAVGKSMATVPMAIAAH